MIRVQLLTETGEWLTGGDELIHRWRVDNSGFIWIDLLGEDATHENNFLLSMGCHPLAVEDVQRFRHPPKTETFDNYTLILYRGITEFNKDLTIQQMTIALFAGERCLISCHPRHSMGINHYWENAHTENLLISPGILASSIMRFSVGRYLEAILAFEPSLTELEDSMQEKPNDEIMRELIAYQARLRKLKRIFSYHEKLVVNLLQDIPQQLIEEDGDIEHALQDLFERCERLHGLCTMYYEICGDLINGYLSISSHQLNNTMRVLTVITAIFVPLTFIAGIYGMNFDNMPELHEPNGYFYALGAMLIIAVGFGGIAYKKWL
ncbi:magnesium transporter CorA family protein [Cellvibrio sp. QJXJ]|uniref:magnesium transporter CorA family protein n=1 Tax=Cellvibrio sp. QJXJ TaxID=2964606 RepID=UPI0021C366CF|nr:magnesium transporter CorA family protein [Cellvibrio sp. QJXJ]UUA74806.1 magnesium transporter CorA family protein [Cellvibrio sp. QJXJ]